MSSGRRASALAGSLILFAAGCGDAGTVSTTPATIAPTITTTIAPLAVTTTSTPPTTTTTAIEDSRTLRVPGGPAPVLDGRLEDDEWAAALVTPVDDDLLLQWLHADGSLYLGVRHTRLGAVNLLVAEEGRVRVLHSSAALGSAEYRLRDDGTWGLVHGFEWCCRVPGDDGGREALLTAEGWTGTIGGVGTVGEVEIRVEIGTGPMRIAVTWVGPAGEATVWPGDIPEDEWDALYGLPNTQERFVPESWMLVVLED